MSTNRSAGGRLRRSSAVLSVTALAATALISTAGPAGAVLTAGADDDATGVATSFHDSEGLALAMCVAAEPFCEPADPTDPTHIGVYFGAEATAGPMLAIFGLEAVQDEETGEPMVVNMARYRANGLRANASYTIKDPWATRSCLTDGRGRLDCVIETGGETGSATNGPVQTFLRGVNETGGFVGNHDLVGAVTGSPSGFNRVSITGPGVSASTNQFSLMGQMVADQAMSQISTRSLSMGNHNNAKAVVRNISYRSVGTAAATPTVRKSGPNPGAFTVVNNCVSVEPGAACNIEVTYQPRANRTSEAVLTISDNSLATPRKVSLAGVGPDTIRARVTSRTPARGSTEVRRGRNIAVKFSEAVRGVRGSTFMLVDNSTDRRVRAAVDGRRGNRWVLNPRRSLKSNHGYTVRVVGGSRAIRDRSNNPARSTSWRFRTR